MEYHLTPGPVTVPDFVSAAYQLPVIHHRTSAFTELMREVQSGLQYMFQTEHPVVLFSGSGSYAMETALRNLCTPDTRVLVTVNGKFGQRWADMCRYMGLKYRKAEAPWGSVAGPAEILKALEDFPAQVLVITHCETSTGIQCDLEEVCFAVRQQYPDMLIVVDSISSAGIVPYYMDAWDIDISLCSSQKALLNIAGMSGIAVSQRAERKLRDFEGFYTGDLRMHLKYLESYSVPNTPPSHIMQGVRVYLQHLQSEGLPTVWNRVHRNAKVFREKILAAGAEIPGTQLCDTLTAFRFPGTDTGKLRHYMSSVHQIHAEGGQDQYAGKYMRIAHFGLWNEADMLHVADAIISGLSTEEANS